MDCYKWIQFGEIKYIIPKFRKMEKRIHLFDDPISIEDFRLDKPYGVYLDRMHNRIAFFNREYRPLTTSPDILPTQIEYSFFPCNVRQIPSDFGEDPREAEVQGRKVIQIFLYNDITNPSNSKLEVDYMNYKNKLAVLEKAMNRRFD